MKEINKLVVCVYDGEIPGVPFSSGNKHGLVKGRQYTAIGLDTSRPEYRYMLQEKPGYKPFKSRFIDAICVDVNDE